MTVLNDLDDNAQEYAEQKNTEIAAEEEEEEEIEKYVHQEIMESDLLKDTLVN